MSVLTSRDVPRLPRGVRLRFDAVRNTQVLLAPERAFDLDGTAAAVLELVNGERSVAAIAAALATRYDADPAEIEADILPMLAELAGKRVIET